LITTPFIQDLRIVAAPRTCFVIRSCRKGQGLCPWTPLEVGPPDLHRYILYGAGLDKGGQKSTPFATVARSRAVGKWLAGVTADESDVGKPLIHSLSEARTRSSLINLHLLLKNDQLAARRPVVEPPFALFEAQMGVPAWDAVVAAKMALGLVPEILDAIDVAAPIDKPLAVVNAAVPELRHIQDT